MADAESAMPVCQPCEVESARAADETTSEATAANNEGKKMVATPKDSLPNPNRSRTPALDTMKITSTGADPSWNPSRLEKLDTPRLNADMRDAAATDPCSESLRAAPGAGAGKGEAESGEGQGEEIPRSSFFARLFGFSRTGTGIGDVDSEANRRSLQGRRRSTYHGLGTIAPERDDSSQKQDGATKKVGLPNPDPEAIRIRRRTYANSERRQRSSFNRMMSFLAGEPQQDELGAAASNGILVAKAIQDGMPEKIVRRLLGEKKKYDAKLAYPIRALEPCDGDLMHWKAKVVTHEGAVMHVHVKLQHTYPFVGPIISCGTMEIKFKAGEIPKASKNAEGDLYLPWTPAQCIGDAVRASAEMLAVHDVTQML